MSNRIQYDQSSSNSAKMLAEAVNKVKEAQDAINRIGDVLNAAIFGDPADDAGVASEVSCAPGEAHDLWVLTDTARAKLNDPALQTFVARLDQG